MKKIITSLLMLSSISMMMTSCEGTEETPIDPEDPFMVVQVDGEPISSISLSSQKDATSSFVVSTNQESSTIDISLDSSLEAWLEASVSEKTVVITTLSKNESTTSNRKGTLTVSAGEDGLLSAEITITQGASQATGEDPNPDPDPDQGVEDYGEDPDLPEHEDITAYSYSISNQKYYYPVATKYKVDVDYSYNAVKARIVPYLYKFTPDYTNASYVNNTNRFGSSTTLPRQTATGRFYTKKIDGRWWVVDPEGCLNHHRALNSVNIKDGDYQDAWNRLFGGDTLAWLAHVRDEMHDLGYHGTGAFGTGLYESYMKINSMSPEKPITYSPSLSMLSAFRSTNTTANAYPDDNSANGIGLVLYDGWAEFCMEYISTALSMYKGDPNLFGIFSNNEIGFTSNSNTVLERFLAISDHTNIAYTTAAKFMEDNGLAANSNLATTDLSNEFEYGIAELYYKPIREAIKALDPDMLYLGSRLHGAAKYAKGTVMAAAKYCDIISINYYSRWDPDYTDEWEAWAEEATDGVGCPFFVTEFYTQASEVADIVGTGAGFIVPSFKESGFAYQHFTLRLLEAKNCVGWDYFAYSRLINYDYELNEDMTDYMRRLNYNVYNLIEYFDK